MSNDNESPQNNTPLPPSGLPYASAQVHLLIAALSKAQAEFPAVVRSRTVRVVPKQGRAYTFSYAPLDDLLQAVMPILLHHELCLLHRPLGTMLRAELHHVSGQWLAAEVELPRVTDVGAQAYGSVQTYMRRYTTAALLELASEEDDDGNVAEGNSLQVCPSRGALLEAMVQAIDPLVGGKRDTEAIKTWCSVQLDKPVATATDLSIDDIKRLTDIAKGSKS